MTWVIHLAATGMISVELAGLVVAVLMHGKVWREGSIPSACLQS